MKTLFSRLSTVVKSNINSAISKAEDPEKMLNQLLLDMNEQYNKAKSEVAVAIADEKKLKRAMETHRMKAEDWQKRAELAVNSGDDQLALEALKQKNEAEAMAVQYEEQWNSQKAATDQLRANLQELNNKVEEAKRKKNLLIARQKRTEAQKTIQETMGNLNDNSVFDTFDRMTEKVETMENEVEALEEINRIDQNLDLEDRFKALEQQGASPLEDELAALKKKMNQ